MWIIERGYRTENSYTVVERNLSPGRVVLGNCGCRRLKAASQRSAQRHSQQSLELLDRQTGSRTIAAMV